MTPDPLRETLDTLEAAAKTLAYALPADAPDRRRLDVALGLMVPLRAHLDRTDPLDPMRVSTCWSTDPTGTVLASLGAPENLIVHMGVTEEAATNPRPDQVHVRLTCSSVRGSADHTGHLTVTRAAVEGLDRGALAQYVGYALLTLADQAFGALDRAAP